MSDELPPPPPPPGFPMPPPPSSNSDDEKVPSSSILEEKEIDFSEEIEIDELKGESEEPIFSPPPPPPGLSELPPPPPGFTEKPQTQDLANNPFSTNSEVSASAPPPMPPGLETTPEPSNSEEEEETQILSDSLSVFGEGGGSESDDIWGDHSFDSELADPAEEEEDILDITSALDSMAPQGASISSSSSPHLRPATEVDAIPGDKLHATLSEIEESTLNPDGSVRRQTIEGELILRNPSKKQRAWDIEVLLAKTESTDLGGSSVTVRELDATEETVIPYSSNGPRMLVLKEKIDTEPERDQEPSLSLVLSPNAHEIKIEIDIENIANVPLNDVELRRTLPDCFEVTETSEYSVDGSTIVWDIGRMATGEIKTLILNPLVRISGVEKIPAGIAAVSYSAESTVSRTEFENVTSSGRQFSRVVAEEDDRPGIWHCKCVFENRSSFIVLLSGATVRLAGREAPILDVSDLRQDIPPEGSWESMVKRVESEDQPSFSQEVKYSILPRVSVHSNGVVDISEQKLAIIDATIKKRYDISRIKSYVPSDIEAVITIENTGSASINVMRFLDDIPGIFQPPLTHKIQIEIEGADLSDDQYRVEIINGNQLEEKLISPDNPGHALRITVGTSSRLGLQPGKSMIIRYPLHAPDPSPQNELLAAPIRADFSMERFGPVATRTVELPPIIKVVHRRRKISTGKEVFPGGGPGRYEILLMFDNNSDSALKDLALHDIVPGTFSIESSSVKSSISGERDISTTKESARDGIKVTWQIGRIEKGERVEVVYEIQGDTEAEYKVSDAQDFHGATFGDEVDEEPNIPEWLEPGAIIGIKDSSPITKPIEIAPRVVESELEITVEETSIIDENSDETLDETTNLDEPEENELVEDDNSEHDSIEMEKVEKIEQNNSCPICGSEAEIGQSICPVCSFSFK
ncbi:MAG: hypothetical protein HN534_01605 [Euryarchaeota archaeon]|jgi:hypothetical protein|nr:hypothetical protein [Euryarchaeota archaeon]MBT3653617.1 hypothetical protein [Euryarchaeota archaeon]MBT3757216.1 hypothetical protein [Euryarchaeota archaeon]MBT4050979.1 hypothetical protein [Euryarchaeota archaeon]MBT4649810.1 hypothetical protein [Euryarchaeota archaeon]